jgi:hypothetical protein
MQTSFHRAGGARLHLLGAEVEVLKLLTAEQARLRHLMMHSCAQAAI